jgi:Flp pilus assembly protein TadG
MSEKRGNGMCSFRRKHWGLRKLLGKFLEDSGNSVVELALIVGLFAPPLLLGTAQLSILIYDSIEVSNAAHAAAMYGMRSLTYASETSQIITAAQTEASDFGTSLAVTPTLYYACSNAVGGTQYTGTNAQSNATAACTGGTNHPLEFVQVVARESVTPMIHFSGLPATMTLTGSSVMEVEE